MARKKTITRDQILNAAHQVISEKGFSHFTARNIATQMNCSTQPIYLEFKNMDDLKEALFDRMAEKTSENFINDTTAGDAFEEFGTQFVLFAQESHQLYQSLYLEDDQGARKMQTAFQSVFETLLAEKTEEMKTPKEDFFLAYFIYVSGLASMVSEKILSFSEEALRIMLRVFLKSIKEGKNDGATLFTLGNFN
ncbi:TetR/AcrR family transcriptional regulator [Enterococcus sp. LJL98]